ncbi:lipoyl(octanoyl) transferase LipB [Desulfobulbus alkaliphilus]|uniref:lipoyl(octanoyl) transferase LipB n=1 Tax=Desulfobulbus alkaliphilus TaxID=869814 RepID=UPI001962FEA7|nr:lipoyl(octanoyl) transferase LipB [Desulfobulbus alkaliphilus]MBM9537558.1 lipoyl(octanoyl) transferase LipB [Desulfobulbus alkaliphilus]
MRIIDTISQGPLAYSQALALQEQLAAAIVSGQAEETLLLVEHPAIYTIGRGGKVSNYLDPNLAVERVNRGGDVTWHGPGQMVGYPLVNLGHRGRDLHSWLRFLEEVLIDLLALFRIVAYRQSGATGVWTDQGKIAFIGIGVRRWVSMHGFSLNVCPDLRAFQHINPCGIKGCPVTSMTREAAAPPSMDEVRLELKKMFAPLMNKRLPKSAQGLC